MGRVVGTDTQALRARINAILRVLLERTGACRTTLRLDDPALGFDINDVAGEALAPGAKSLRGQTSINQRAAATAQWIDRERRLLVQGDLARDEPRPPQPLIDLYGVKAQMLAPLVREGRLDGWISVHEACGARSWSASDQAAALQAAEEVLALLGSK